MAVATKNRDVAADLSTVMSCFLFCNNTEQLFLQNVFLQQVPGYIRGGGVSTDVTTDYSKQHLCLCVHVSTVLTDCVCSCTEKSVNVCVCDIKEGKHNSCFTGRNPHFNPAHTHHIWQQWRHCHSVICRLCVV